MSSEDTEKRKSEYFKELFKAGLNELEHKKKDKPFCPIIKDSCELTDCEFFIFDETGAECSVKRIGKSSHLLSEISGAIGSIYQSL